MITDFTPATAANSGSGSGSNTMVTVLVIAAVVAAGYFFIVKPMLEKNQPENER